MTKIEQLIDEIEEFIESCKAAPLSVNKVVVPKSELYDLLTELRLKTPDEIKRYQKIIGNRDAILAEAKEQAEEIITQAQEHTSNLVSEHEIMQQAYMQANEIVRNATEEASSILDNAKKDANIIRLGSLEYAEGLLGNIENVFNHTMESTKSKYETLISSVNDNLNILINNKNEINEQIRGSAVEQEVATEQEDNGEFDYNFDDDAFTKEL